MTADNLFVLSCCLIGKSRQKSVTKLSFTSQRGRPLELRPEVGVRAAASNRSDRPDGHGTVLDARCLCSSRQC